MCATDEARDAVIIKEVCRDMKSGRVQRAVMGFAFISAMILLFGGRAMGSKSLYVLTDHDTSTLRAYEIAGSQLYFEGEVQVSNYAMGAVDVAIDSNIRRLFVTYETASQPRTVVWANALNFEEEGVMSIPTPSTDYRGLAGIVTHPAKGRAYTVSRQRDELYILWWDPDNRQLVLMDPQDPSKPYSGGDGEDAHIQLEGLSTYGAFGAAFDTTTGLLYVANNTEEVHIYDSNQPGWPLTDVRDMGREVVGIALDPNEGEHDAFLYGGGLYTGGASGHRYLIKHNLQIDQAAEEANTETYIDAVAVGVAVDTETGLVYTTISDKELRVYDCSVEPFELLYWIATGGMGAGGGLCIPDEDVSYKPLTLELGVVDDVPAGECITPEDPNLSGVTYTISFANPVTDENDPNYIGDVNDVVVTDYFPADVDFGWAQPDIGSYDSSRRCYHWPIGRLEPGDSNSVSITLYGTEFAEPLSQLWNIAEIESEHCYNQAFTETDVCCWGGDLIYVDRAAAGHSTGLSWDDAYNDLQDALGRTQVGCGCEIWVAEGSYKPTTTGDAGVSFELVGGVALYGGFEGGESEREQRRPALNHTVLSGEIGTPDSGDNSQKVVTASESGASALIDGFTISDGQYGIYCTSGGMMVRDCAVADNTMGGIFSSGDELRVQRCVVKDNEGDGVRKSNAVLTMEGCRVWRNDGHGLNGQYCTVDVTNNWISHSQSTGGACGIYLNYPSAGGVIRNNTIVYNQSWGIAINSGTEPMIRNCILWGNNDEWEELNNCAAKYSCVEGSDDPEPAWPDYTINQYPEFAYTDPNLFNFHLTSYSPCIDLGDDPNGDGSYHNETDIDGRPRVVNGRVDMGADEYECADVFSQFDVNADAVVDVVDYGGLARAWGSDEGDDPNDPNTPYWDERYDFDGSGAIDLADLAEFVVEWLWRACYLEGEPQAGLLPEFNQPGRLQRAKQPGEDRRLAAFCLCRDAFSGCRPTCVFYLRFAGRGGFS